MEKAIIDDIRKELEKFQEELDSLRHRLEALESQCSDGLLSGGEPFPGPISLDIDIDGYPESASVEEAGPRADGVEDVAGGAEAAAAASPGRVADVTATPPVTEIPPVSAIPPVTETPAGGSSAPEKPEPGYRWMKDECGKKISNVLSGLSLNDRAGIFNGLFKGDADAFAKLISGLNASQTFDEAAAFVFASCPDWDMESAPVYNLMMAVRRRFC